MILLTGAANANEAPNDRLVNDRCPVTAEEFASPLHEMQFKGVSVRFCCDECRERFEDDPIQYVSRLPQLPAETVQALIAGGQEQAKAARAAQWIDRWSQPLLLGGASVVVIWLLLRIAHRWRSSAVDESPGEPG